MNAQESSDERRPFSFAVAMEYAGVAALYGICALILFAGASAFYSLGKQAVGNEARARIASLKPNAQLSACIESQYGDALRKDGILRVIPQARRSRFLGVFVNITTLAVYRTDWDGLKVTSEYFDSAPDAGNGITGDFLGPDQFLYAVDARVRPLVVSVEPGLTRAGFMDTACNSIGGSLSSYGYATGELVSASVQAARAVQDAALTAPSVPDQTSKEARPSDR